MSQGPRRGASVRTSLASIVILACLAALAAGLPLLRGSAAGAEPETSRARPRPAGPAMGSSRRPGWSPRRVLSSSVPPGARIERIAVKEGDEIAGGAVLAVLEGHAQAALQVAVAEAQKKNAAHQRALGRDKLAIEREREDKLRKERLEAQERLVDVTKRRLKAATEIYQKVGKPLPRTTSWSDSSPGVLPGRGRGHQGTDRAQGIAGRPGPDREGGAVEDRSLTDDGPETEVLDRQLDLARALGQTTVLSPTAGRILEISAHAGEVSSGPIASLGDVSAMVAMAEVYQSDIPEVKVGNPAEVTVLGRKLAGKVTDRPDGRQE